MVVSAMNQSGTATPLGPPIDYETVNDMVRQLRRMKRLSKYYSHLEVAVFGNDFELATCILEYHKGSDFWTSDMCINKLLRDVIGKINKNPWLERYVDLLIEFGALETERDKPNGSGRTALDESITHNHVGIAWRLLVAGANVNYLQDIGGLSPLMDAIFDRNKNESETMAHMLIDKGANIEYKTSWGMSVIDACTHRERVNIMNRVLSLNPLDTEGFAKALDWITKQLDQMPRYLRNANKPPTYKILCDAIRNAEEMERHTIRKVSILDKAVMTKIKQGLRFRCGVGKLI
jgi:hypothetical protein